MNEVITDLLARLVRVEQFGFVVTSLIETGDDAEVWVGIETAADVVACEKCGTRAKSKDRRCCMVRDLEVIGRPCVFVWDKRVWKCPDKACAVKTWTERRDDFALPRHGLTARARYEICRSVGEDNHSVAELARRFGIGWHTAWNAVETVGESLVDDPDRLEGVTALGMDEHNFMKATPDSPTQYVTTFIDLDRSIVLDLVEGRDAVDARGWFDGRSSYWRDAIEVCAFRSASRVPERCEIQARERGAGAGPVPCGTSRPPPCRSGTPPCAERDARPQGPPTRPSVPFTQAAAHGLGTAHGQDLEAARECPRAG